MTSSLDIPLRKCSLPLKRVRLDENETLAMLILDLAFPYFRGQTAVHRNLEQIYTLFFGTKSLDFLHRDCPRRRFSGGTQSSQPLPRGRYYAVCDISSGKPDDHGLLRFELSAYSNHCLSGPVKILDRGREDEQRMIEHLGIPPAVSSQAFTIIVFRKACAPGLHDILFNLKGIDSDIDFDDYGGAFGIYRFESNLSSFFKTDIPRGMHAFSFNLYYEIETIAFDRVVDLRYPNVQAAFADLFFPSLTRCSNVGPLHAFAQMLPTLVSTDHGGNETTDAIGNFLRAYGVDALIYPSARFNGGVRFNGDSIADFGGWNLVDYRHTENITDYRIPPFPLFEANCPLQILPFGADIDECPLSWKIKGLREHAMSEFEKDARSYFKVQE